MKKQVIYYADEWTERLLTLSRLKEVAYFVDATKAGGEFYGKPIYKPTILQKENQATLSVIISNSRKYEEAKEVLLSLGLVENQHFFNGWKLDVNFYNEQNGDWITAEKENKHILTDHSTEWRARAKLLATMIPSDVRSVLDVGMGEGFLREFLPEDIKYYGLDYVKRYDNCIVCDLNKDDLPDLQVDLYYMSASLQLVDDKEKLISQMTRAKYILVTLQPTDQFIKLDGCFWITPCFQYQVMSNDEFINLCYQYGFILIKADYPYKEFNNHHYLFKNTRYEPV